MPDFALFHGDARSVRRVRAWSLFLAGSILLNVFREELPNSNLASYRWFVLGVSLITFIMLLQTWLVNFLPIKRW